MTSIQTPIGGWHRQSDLELPAASPNAREELGLTAPKPSAKMGRRGLGFGLVSMLLSENYVDAHPRLAGLLCATVLWIPAAIIGSLSDPTGVGLLMGFGTFFAGLRFAVAPPAPKPL